MHQTFALDEKIGGVENCLRQTFAPDQNLGKFRKLLRRIFALYKTKN
jgi:hypothetical protein